MTTFNSKRFAKLAGLLKENLTDRLEDETSSEATWELSPLPNELDPEARDRYKEYLGRMADEVEKAYKKQKEEDAENAADLADLETEKDLGGPGGKHGFGRPVKESRKSNKQVLSSSPVSVSLKAAMKSCDHLNECGCQMQTPFNAPEDEPQGYMLVQNLKKLAAKATELSTMANHDDDAEPWVESKINSAAQHIDAIYDYIKYGRPSEPHMMHHEKDIPHDDFSDVNMHVVNTYERNE